MKQASWVCQGHCFCSSYSWSLSSSVRDMIMIMLCNAFQRVKRGRCESMSDLGQIFRFSFLNSWRASCLWSFMAPLLLFFLFFLIHGPFVLLYLWPLSNDLEVSFLHKMLLLLIRLLIFCTKTSGFCVLTSFHCSLHHKISGHASSSSFSSVLAQLV